MPGASPASRRAGRVRRARREDLERVLELWETLTEQHASLDVAFATRPGSAPTVRRLLEETLHRAESCALVWEEAARVFGLCLARIERNGLSAEGARAEITDIVVARAARRRGIGRALVASALVWASEQGVRRVEVRVATKNRVAQHFWRQLGFCDFVDVLDRRL